MSLSEITKFMYLMFLFQYDKVLAKICSNSKLSPAPVKKLLISRYFMISFDIKFPKQRFDIRKSLKGSQVINKTLLVVGLDFYG